MQLRTYTYFALPPPNAPRLSLLVDKCISMNQLKQVHAQMIISARIFDNFAASRLICFCALSQAGDLNYAFRIFGSTCHPNSFMYNTLIRALASGPNPLEGLLLFIDMRRLNVVPGKHTFPFLLKACSNSHSLLHCKQVHTQILKFGLDIDLHVINGLVRGYSVSNNLVEARFLFDEFPEKNLSLWTTIISAYAQSYCSNEALMLFNQMIAQGFEPNGATLASVLSACARAGCLDLGERIHEFMKNKGIEVGVILGTALVYMYAKNGAIMKAQKVFENMLERNIATWNAMICGLAACGHAEDSLILFQKLTKEQLVPNDVTFIGVLSACCHAGLLDVGCDIFHSMKPIYGIEPNIEHYGCVIDLLGRGGKLLEAEELVKEMPWKADVVILGALLAATKNTGNTKLAERVVKEILALEPHNHGVHVALSNMYAEAGQWQEVLRLRKMMKEERLKKAPGWSLVDT
ncbi:pentatricopeptide repeat-containing protein At5g56310-like isoform X1 [Prosopis cineraria]|uniref:pentatricopeptide repeat-containing protein At5g56310-like isoform X1 n=1 Tax=Prosopis cineraria TaxID=364024 RepID=UPI00240FB036|nr:pentatricopeptide repeat-containing protein At5g56310-like isoform X1 [Prosopis cineraria]